MYHSICGLFVYLIESMRPVIAPDEQVMTWKFARFVSLTFTFEGFTDEEVFDVLKKEVNRRKKVLK